MACGSNLFFPACCTRMHTHSAPKDRRCLLQVLILFAALSTCDPGNILETIRAAKQQRVRVSIVGLAAEVHICRRITEVHNAGIVTPCHGPA